MEQLLKFNTPRLKSSFSRVVTESDNDNGSNKNGEVTVSCMYDFLWIGQTRDFI